MELLTIVLVAIGLYSIFKETHAVIGNDKSYMYRFISLDAVKPDEFSN